jgi:hypothetical protein
VRDTVGEEKFEHGRLWLWYEGTDLRGDVNRYRLVDYKFGTIWDRYEHTVKISLLEDSGFA